MNREECKIHTVYCGKAPRPPRGYSHKGSSYECLRQGYGAGKWAEKTKHLPLTSLMQIKFINERYQTRFKSKQIYSQKSLLEKMNVLTLEQKKNLLKSILTLKSGNLDKRAYNSVLLFLDNHFITNLPRCIVS